MKKSVKINAAFLGVILLLVTVIPNGKAEALPVGFELITVAEGFFLPTAVVFTPDGRIFVAEKGGVVKVVKDGAVLETPLITLENINTYGDRGLIGMAIDPNFAVNGYLYLAYTHENDAANYQGFKTGRIVRVTVTGDVADPETLTILLGTVAGDALNPSCLNFATSADCIPSDSPSHSVGGLHFGPDGYLYATLGDGSQFEGVDMNALRALDLDSLGGKFVRINTDGAGVATNPFFTGDATANRSKVFSYGLRNAFRFSFQPETNLAFLGDVGWYSYEEVNVASGGESFGWPCREGLVQTEGYNCVTTGYTDPFYYYAHDPVTGAGSVTGGAFITNPDVPVEYQNNYIFGDYAINFLKRMVLDENNQIVSVEDFIESPDGPVEFVTGPEGDIYYLSIYTGELRHIRYNPGNRQPVVVMNSDVNSGSLPLAVNFSSVGSNDPDNHAITYAWDFGDGNTTTDANPTHTYTTAGTYTATLTITDELGAFSADTLTIVAGNLAPSVSITNPPNNSTYRPGQIIPVFGEGTDPEDGDLPESAYQWDIILHHNVHTHLLEQLVGQNSSFFVTTDHGAEVDVYIEVKLTVTDSAGLTATDSIDLTLAPAPDVAPTHVSSTLETSAPSINQALTWTSVIGNTGAETPILVDFEIFNSLGEKIFQVFHDGEVIHTNGSNSYTETWTPTVAGTYRLAVGLIHQNWQGLYQWTHEALSITVADGPTEPVPFTPEHDHTTVTPTVTAVGSPITIETFVTNAGTEAGDAIVDIEVFNTVGDKIGQGFFDTEHFDPGQTRSFSWDYIPTEEGEYRVAIGLIHPTWSGLYQWTNDVGTISVSNTPPPPTPTDGALNFDGVDDHVDVGIWNIEEFVGFSFEATFRATEITNTDYLLVKSAGGDFATHDWAIGITPTINGNGELLFVVKTTDGALGILTGGSVAPDELVRVAGVYDNGQMRLYKNGVLVASEPLAGLVSVSQAQAWIGDNPGSPTNGAFDGRLYEMRVWNMPRSEAEINEKLGVELVGNEIGLIKYWKFDEGFGQDVIDNSNSGHHGTLGSSATLADAQDPAREGGDYASGGTFNPVYQSIDVTPAIGSIGNPTTLDVTITNEGDGPGYMIVNFQVHDSTGAKVDQKFYDGMGFAPGETRTFTHEWIPGATGEYHVEIGLVKLYWSDVYAWVGAAADITVGDIPVPDPVDPIVIYDDAPASGWGNNWSWGTTADFAVTDPVFAGEHSLEVTFSDIWGGLYIANDGSVDTTDRTNFTFMIHGGTSGGQNLQIRLYDAARVEMVQVNLAPYVAGGIAAGEWKLVSIPLADLDATDTLVSGFVIQGASGEIEEPFYLDSVEIQ